MKASRKGSVLGASMVVAVAIVIVLAGLLKWADTEKNVNLGHQLAMKAGYGAEGTGEFALAQIIARLQSQPIILTDQFKTGENAPLLPPAELMGSSLSDILTSLVGDEGLTSVVLDELGGLLGGGEEEEVSEPEPIDDALFTVTPLAINVGSFSAESNVYFDPNNPLYANDPLRNQNVRVRTVRVLASAKAEHKSQGSGSTAYCEYTLQVRDAPLFNFMAFYNMDLEISPGPPMELYGPVHSNGDIYVSSGDSVEFHGVVTAAEGIYHARAPGSGMSVSSGDVSFLDDEDGQVSMLQGGTWVDSTQSGWSTQALNLWEGNVLSGTHGVSPTLPAGTPPYTPDDPATAENELLNEAHELIDPAVTNDDDDFKGNEVESQRYASKASLVIEVDHNVSGGTWDLSARIYKYTPDVDGTYVRATDAGYGTFRREELSVPAGLISYGSFYDAREARTVRSADVDIGVLKSAIENDVAAAAFTNGATTFAPATEWNGVVYAEHTNPALDASNLGAIRLINGTSLPNRPTAANDYARGLAFSTNAPLYIKGNYNADGTIPSDGSAIVDPEAGEPPAAIAGDAVTILSTSWDDATSTSSVDDRAAAQTEVAAAVLSGLVPTNKNNNGTFSGGLENLVRFLEDWDGIKLGLRTSLGVMFESEVATSPWGSSNTYRPPIRVWGFNALFGQGDTPPGTPGVRTYRRLGYRRLNEAEYQSALTEISGS